MISGCKLVEISDVSLFSVIHMGPSQGTVEFYQPRQLSHSAEEVGVSRIPDTR